MNRSSILVPRALNEIIDQYSRYRLEIPFFPSRNSISLYARATYISIQRQRTSRRREIQFRRVVSVPDKRTFRTNVLVKFKGFPWNAVTVITHRYARSASTRLNKYRTRRRQTLYPDIGAVNAYSERTNTLTRFVRWILWSFYALASISLELALLRSLLN